SSTALRDSIEQVQVMGFVTATSDGYFELPGGPLQLVIGAEYRRDIATQGADLGDALGLTFFNSSTPGRPPSTGTAISPKISPTSMVPEVGEKALKSSAKSRFPCSAAFLAWKS
ncbi:MAG: hypothetical protein AAFX94_03355, partial [Myxococcota bacterium]